jgi:hypothetical protein
MRVRQELPSRIVSLLEERVNDRGEFAVLGVLGDDVQSTRRLVITANRTYEAFVYGRRLTQTSKDNIPVHGIAVENALALQASPLRRIEPGERIDPALLAQAAGTCPISKQTTTEPVLVQVGTNLHRLCRAGHIETLAAGLEEEESGLGPIAMPASAWTEGTKSVLYIRAVFQDDATEPISEADAYDVMADVDEFFAQNSYGATELVPTVTPLITLPRTKAGYATNNNDVGLLRDARTAAAAAGFNPSSYNLYCVRFKSIFPGWSGMAYIGNKGVWLQSSTATTASHELGHNFGLHHANFWKTTDGTTIGAGSNQEYGDVYDTMGNGSGPNAHYNSCHKNRLGWLPDSAVHTATTNGIYRLYAHDVDSLQSDRKYALKVHKDARDYWIETRLKISNNASLQTGVLLLWSPWAQSTGGTQLLDTTPGSTSGRNDAALQIGRTFEDTDAHLQISPLGVANTNPRSIDVLVIFTATLATGPPALEIAATPDGYALTISSAPSVLTLERSSDLHAWSPFDTLTNLTGRTQYIDNSAPSAPRRFYRIRQ